MIINVDKIMTEKCTGDSMPAFRFRLTTFNAYDDESGKTCAERPYEVQMFGINENGQNASITAQGFTPFFYVKVPEHFRTGHKAMLVHAMYQAVNSQWYEDTIVSTTLVKRHKFYGFDAKKQHKFVRVDFSNEQAWRKFKNLWYMYEKKGKEYKRTLTTFEVNGHETELYEAQIPPLLRLFHLKGIKPSGWISVPKAHIRTIPKHKRKTNLDFEIAVDWKRIISHPDLETQVPYTVMSFDIEASSSHGDFPLAKKNYKALAKNMVDVWEDRTEDKRTNEYIEDIITTAFGYNYEPVFNVDRIYPKQQPPESMITGLTNAFVKRIVKNEDFEDMEDEDMDSDDDDDFYGAEGLVEDGAEESSGWSGKKKRKSIKTGLTPLEILNNDRLDRETKINSLNVELTKTYPPVKGDEVTFIGSTFWRVGEDEPYLNHCIVKDTCNDLGQVANAQFDSYKTESEVLLAWTKLVQKENPDIVTGYNIFGFDYPFMYTRTKELGITREFLKLSRNNGEICWKKDWKTGKTNIEENTIIIASGQHDLKFIKMNGRLQVDMYNYFRRDYNLTSYKLDYVSGYFIGDGVKEIYHEEDGTTKIVSKNLQGLEQDCFVSFDEEAHSVDAYKDGAKFQVIKIDEKKGTFWINGHESPDMNKKVKWGMAKDDVTPQDIFRMTNEGPNERYLIAKYCIQDCNLVHHLMRKIDVMTGYIEMASLCSVPMDFLVMRGQGIKLTSFLAMKCREKNTLMPVLDKADSDEGYEGAIVLPPKSDLYLDDPVACVDYSSLYPSSMISENISPDSKVWTKEYNLEGTLIATWGETKEDGSYTYDNLDGYKYVDVTYDTYQWRRKNNNPKSAMEKVKVGYKTCRFAQFPDGELGILPAILKECLASRKATRKLIPTAPTEFMKNVLDKRQLSIKVTANSVYGQTGAKTSTFYEKDVAASTTATGRKLLTYGQRVIEEAYKNRIVDTKQGQVKTNAEYVYGDTDSVFFKFNLEELDGTPIKGQKALELTIELAIQAGELASKFLKPPHDLEYEKTFLPFCLLSKKRYVGMLYETDPHKCKRKSMGIVLKRRDNAGVVKDVYGGIIDILMKDKDIEKAASFLGDSLKGLIEGEVGIPKLIITKALRGNYKNPKQIAHKVLADRIGRRDPGNKPSIGDRIPYVYFKNPDKKALQGDKIELPAFIEENKLEIDYAHYITNQIMKPVQQVFALVLEKMKLFRKKKGASLRVWYDQINKLKEKHPDEETFKRRLETLRNREVKGLLFDDWLTRIENKRKGNGTVADYFDM